MESNGWPGIFSEYIGECAGKNALRAGQMSPSRDRLSCDAPESPFSPGDSV
jgi:hypothetical protein